jgi:hypothetical protein
MSFKLVWALPNIGLECDALGFGLRLTQDFRGLKVKNSNNGIQCNFDIMRICTIYKNIP